MMEFRTIKDAIICNVLGPNANGEFQVVEYQPQGKAAEDVVDKKRMVQVFYDSGDLPKSAGSRLGPVSHDATFRVELTVAAFATSDLTILDDPGASDDDRAQALREMLESGARADVLFDELVDLVYQILMDTRHRDLGLKRGRVADTWISRIQKNKPLDKGEYVLLTGTMDFSCRVSEDLTGEPLGDAGNKVFSTVVDHDGDDVEKTGAEVTAP